MKRERNRQLRVSRVLLTVCGFVLIAIGVFGLLLATGALGHVADGIDSDSTLLDRDGRVWLADHQLVLQVVGALVGLLLIALGAWWLRAQLPPLEHHRNIEVGDRDPAQAGTTSVRSEALEEALRLDLQRSPLVERARTALQRADDRLRLRLDVTERAGADEIRDVVEPAVERLVTVAGLRERPELEVDLRPVDRREPRVV